MAKQSIWLALLVGTALLGQRAAGASVGDGNENAISFHDCVRQTADYISQVEIDDQVRALVDELRQYNGQDIDRISYQIPVYPEGCNAVRERVENARSNVACNAEFQLDGYVVLESSKSVLRNHQGARDVVEAHFACQVADGVSGLISQYSSFMSQYGISNDGEQFSEESNDDVDSNSLNEDDGNNNSFDENN